MQSACSGTVPGAHVGRYWGSTHCLLANVYTKEQLPESEERHKRSVRVKWYPTANWVVEEQLCHSARPARTHPAPPETNNAPASGKSQVGTTDEEPRTRAVNTSVRLPDRNRASLPRAELFNRRLTGCVKEPTMFSIMRANNVRASKTYTLQS